MYLKGEEVNISIKDDNGEPMTCKEEMRRRLRICSHDLLNFICDKEARLNCLFMEGV